jgi:hypothetical protein
MKSARLELRVERADVLRVRKAIVEFGGAGLPVTFGRNDQAVNVPRARPGTKPDYFLVVTVVCMALMTALFAVPFVVRLLAQP